LTAGAFSNRSEGNVYIGDGGNNAIRMVAPSGIMSTPIGGGAFGSPKDGAPAKASVFSPRRELPSMTGAVYHLAVLSQHMQVDNTGAFLTISGRGLVARMGC
jgi:hypothetical protein